MISHVSRQCLKSGASGSRMKYERHMKKMKRKMGWCSDAIWCELITCDMPPFCYREGSVTKGSDESPGAVIFHNLKSGGVIIFQSVVTPQLGLTYSLNSMLSTHRRHCSLIISQWNGIRRILFSLLTCSGSAQTDSRRLPHLEDCTSLC